jgi:thiol:disulfide interchange protein DsbD
VTVSKAKFLLVAAVLFLSACAKPAADTNQSASAGSVEPPQIASTDVVKANPQELTLAKGESGYAVVHLLIQNGYHINANPPSFPYLKATELELTPANGLSVEFVSYPDALTRKFSFSPDPLKVYEGDTPVKAMLKAGPSATAGTHNLSAKLRVQACDDRVCYPPGVIDLSVPVTIK